MVETFPETKKILPILLRPLYFASGIFFSASMIPYQFRGLLGYNPVLCLIENIRCAVNGHEVGREFGLLYPMGWALVMGFTGLALYRRNWMKLVAS